jgi:hypothetical protein
MTRAPQLGTPQRRGVGWWVPSGAAGVGDYVELTKDVVRCTCPSFVWRRTRLPRGECKHIVAVRAMPRQQVGA